MRHKLIVGLMVTLFLMSMLTMIGSVSAPIPPSQGNINGDDRVDILDVVKWALAFGSTSANTTGNWDPAADINGDNVVNILDGIIIGVNFGSVDP